MKFSFSVTSTSFPGSLLFPPLEREKGDPGLVWSGHVSPRIWEITKDNIEGGAAKSGVWLYLGFHGRESICIKITHLVCVTVSGNSAK